MLTSDLTTAAPIGSGRRKSQPVGLTVDAVKHVKILKGCGVMVPATKVIRGFTFRAEVWYSTDILTSVPPPMTAADEIFTDDPESGDEITPCYSYTFTTDWTNYKSFCVKRNLAVSYTDGTCCVYQDRICKEKYNKNGI